MTARLAASDRSAITATARELYATMSLEDVADELRERGFRVSATTVRNLLVAAGVELRRHGGPRARLGERPPGGRADPLGDEERALILSVASEIYPAQPIPTVTQEVARRGLHVSAQTVRRVLVSAGVEMAPRGPRPAPERERTREQAAPSSPRVAAWEAMCGLHRRRLGIHQRDLGSVVRALAGLRELNPRQQARLDKARDELHNEQSGVDACPDCRGGTAG